MVFGKRIQFFVFCVLFVQGLAPSQAKMPGGSKMAGKTGTKSKATEEGGKKRILVIDNYSKDLAIKVFLACDLNRDDVMTFREARASLAAISTGTFRWMDSNKDGAVDLREFDRAFEQRIREGRNLVLIGKTAEKIKKVPSKKPLPPSILALFRLVDLDRDGRISPSEWRNPSGPFAQLLFQVPHGFFGLDKDRDGMLSKEEFSVLAVYLPLFNLPKGLDLYMLPLEITKADMNGDNQLSKEEFVLFLEKLDPGLVSWVNEIFQSIDVNRDGILSGRELRKAIKNRRRTG